MQLNQKKQDPKISKEESMISGNKIHNQILGNKPRILISRTLKISKGLI